MTENTGPANPYEPRPAGDGGSAQPPYQAPPQQGAPGPAPAAPTSDAAPWSAPAQPAAPYDGSAPASPYGSPAPSAPATPSSGAGSAAPYGSPASAAPVPSAGSAAPYGSPASAAPQEPADPYAVPGTGGAAPQGYGAPHAGGHGAPKSDPYAVPPQSGAAPGAQGHGPQGPYAGPQGGYGPQPGGAPGAGAPSTPPAGFKGIYEGPLTGQPVSPSDVKLWSILAQLSTVAGYVLGAGFLGWVGPLIVFVIYKDRDRYVRYNAAEALNAAIAVLIAEIALSIVITIIAVVTFGLGSVLYVLLAVPVVLHLIFAIIGAVKANELSWWNYPVNIRLVK